MNPMHTDEIPKRFIDAIATSTSRVLSQALATAWRVSPDDVLQQTADPLVFVVAVAESIRGHFSIAIPRTDAAQLAAVFMGEAAPETAQWSPEIQEGIEELLRQVTGQLETELTNDCGLVTLRLSAEGPPFAPSAEVAISASSGIRRIPIVVRIDDELLSSLRSLSPLTSPSRVVVKEPTAAERNLDLLMDVELGATLRFGRKVMKLRQILELTSGSVIELDRQVHEPADLLLEGKLIAKGEVVIVEGNYGLRITEVASQQQKSGLEH